MAKGRRGRGGRGRGRQQRGTGVRRSLDPFWNTRENRGGRGGGCNRGAIACKRGSTPVSTDCPTLAESTNAQQFLRQRCPVYEHSNRYPSISSSGSLRSNAQYPREAQGHLLSGLGSREAANQDNPWQVLDKLQSQVSRGMMSVGATADSRSGTKQDGTRMQKSARTTILTPVTVKELHRSRPTAQQVKNSRESSQNLVCLPAAENAINTHVTPSSGSLQSDTPSLKSLETLLDKQKVSTQPTGREQSESSQTIKDQACEFPLSSGLRLLADAASNRRPEDTVAVPLPQANNRLQRLLSSPLGSCSSSGYSSTPNSTELPRDSQIPAKDDHVSCDVPSVHTSSSVLQVSQNCEPSDQSSSKEKILEPDFPTTGSRYGKSHNESKTQVSPCTGSSRTTEESSQIVAGNVQPHCGLSSQDCAAVLTAANGQSQESCSRGDYMAQEKEDPAALPRDITVTPPSCFEVSTSGVPASTSPEPVIFETHFSESVENTRLPQFVTDRIPLAASFDQQNQCHTAVSTNKPRYFLPHVNQEPGSLTSTSGVDFRVVQENPYTTPPVGNQTSDSETETRKCIDREEQKSNDGDCTKSNQGDEDSPDGSTSSRDFGSPYMADRRSDTSTTTNTIHLYGRGSDPDSEIAIRSVGSPGFASSRDATTSSRASNSRYRSSASSDESSASQVLSPSNSPTEPVPKEVISKRASANHTNRRSPVKRRSTSTSPEIQFLFERNLSSQLKYVDGPLGLSRAVEKSYTSSVTSDISRPSASAQRTNTTPLDGLCDSHSGHASYFSFHPEDLCIGDTQSSRFVTSTPNECQYVPSSTAHSSKEQAVLFGSSEMSPSSKDPLPTSRHVPSMTPTEMDESSVEVIPMETDSLQERTSSKLNFPANDSPVDSRLAQTSVPPDLSMQLDSLCGFSSPALSLSASDSISSRPWCTTSSSISSHSLTSAVQDPPATCEISEKSATTANSSCSSTRSSDTSTFSMNTELTPDQSRAALSGVSSHQNCRSSNPSTTAAGQISLQSIPSTGRLSMEQVSSGLGQGQQNMPQPQANSMSPPVLCSPEHGVQTSTLLTYTTSNSADFASPDSTSTSHHDPNQVTFPSSLIKPVADNFPADAFDFMYKGSTGSRSTVSQVALHGLDKNCDGKYELLDISDSLANKEVQVSPMQTASLVSTTSVTPQHKEKSLSPPHLLPYSPRASVPQAAPLPVLSSLELPLYPPFNLSPIPEYSESKRVTQIVESLDSTDSGTSKPDVSSSDANEIQEGNYTHAHIGTHSLSSCMSLGPTLEPELAVNMSIPFTNDEIISVTANLPQAQDYSAPSSGGVHLDVIPSDYAVATNDGLRVPDGTMNSASTSSAQMETPSLPSFSNTFFPRDGLFTAFQYFRPSFGFPSMENNDSVV